MKKMFPDEMYGFKRLEPSVLRIETIESYRNEKNVYIAVRHNHKTKRINIAIKKGNLRYKMKIQYTFTEVNEEVIEDLKEIAKCSLEARVNDSKEAGEKNGLKNTEIIQVQSLLSQRMDQGKFKVGDR